MIDYFELARDVKAIGGMTFQEKEELFLELLMQDHSEEEINVLFVNQVRKMIEENGTCPCGCGGINIKSNNG